MRRRMLLLSLAAAALVGALTASPSSATGGVCQPICTHYSDGSQCCVSCFGTWPNCGCTNNYCPPEDGGN
ncbi:MAG TPA: hypothetical protein VGM86_20565 [Thermoanaerobaculia bacterium]